MTRESQKKKKKKKKNFNLPYELSELIFLLPKRMSKRAATEDFEAQEHSAPKINDEQLPPAKEVEGDVNDEVGEFEDPYGDEFESDGEIVELDGNEEEDEEMGEEDGQKKIEELEKNDEKEPEVNVYLPHKAKPLGPDEILEPDPSVYEMLHQINMPWPCLTIDILPDHLGNERRSYPASMYIATATQAERSKNNELIAMKLSSLGKTLEKDEEEEDEEDEDDDEDVDPVMDSESTPLKYTTNRLRVSPHSLNTNEYLTAVMQESGEVHIFDVSSQYTAFDTPGYMIPKSSKRPVHTIRNHGNVEGYGLDWSPLINTGTLLSGDCTGRVYLTNRTTSKWVTDKTPFVASDDSIEDIQWSPAEKTVFSTGGCDGYVRVWDTRSKKHKPAISVKASTSDVNVLSWSNRINYLLASGHDDGTWGVWDLRSFKSQAPTPVAHYDYHRAPITSISFNPLDESVVAVSSEDNTVSLWDLAVEADDEEISAQKKELKELQDIPPQFLFLHWQRSVKDVRWHSQIPGCLVSTGSDGLNIWKTISV